MSSNKLFFVTAAFIGSAVALTKSPEARKFVANKLRTLSSMLDPQEIEVEQQPTGEVEYPRSAYSPVPHQPMWEPPADDSVDTEDLISSMYRIAKENPPRIGFS